MKNKEIFGDDKFKTHQTSYSTFLCASCYEDRNVYDMVENNKGDFICIQCQIDETAYNADEVRELQELSFDNV